MSTPEDAGGAGKPRTDPTAADTNAASNAEPLAALLQNTKLASLDPRSRPSGGAILQAMGGIRGLIESLAPGILFLILYTATHDVVVAVVASLGLSVLFVVLRVVVRGQSTLAFAGLIGVGLSAAVALLTGNAADNFLWGFLVNGATLLALAISLLVRKPLVGLIVGGLTGTPYAWRTQPAKRTVATRSTWLLLVLFAARLAVQLPIYLVAQHDPAAVSVLAATKLAMGVPLYAAALWVVWLMVRTVIDTPEDAAPGATR